MCHCSSGRSEAAGDFLGQLGLAGAGLALDQDGPAQGDRRVDGGHQVLGGDVAVGAGEACIGHFGFPRENHHSNVGADLAAKNFPNAIAAPTVKYHCASAMFSQNQQQRRLHHATPSLPAVIHRRGGCRLAAHQPGAGRRAGRHERSRRRCQRGDRQRRPGHAGKGRGAGTQRPLARPPAAARIRRLRSRAPGAQPEHRQAPGADRAANRRRRRHPGRHLRAGARSAGGGQVRRPQLRRQVHLRWRHADRPVDLPQRAGGPVFEDCLHRRRQPAWRRSTTRR